MGCLKGCVTELDFTEITAENSLLEEAPCKKPYPNIGVPVLWCVAKSMSRNTFLISAVEKFSISQSHGDGDEFFGHNSFPKGSHTTT